VIDDSNIYLNFCSNSSDWTEAV